MLYRNGGRPPSCSGGWALRAGIGMTIILPGHRMSVTRHYFCGSQSDIVVA